MIRGVRLLVVLVVATLAGAAAAAQQATTTPPSEQKKLHDADWLDDSGQHDKARRRQPASVPTQRPPTAAPQLSYDALIATIVGLIQAGKINEAVPKAIEAVTLQPARYDGHLYLGIIRFRQHATAEAEASLRQALSLAPDDRRLKVQDALDLVVNTRQFVEFMATAEEAEKQGAKAKAARSYAAAWWLFNDRADIAAKAVRGLMDTNSDFEAARVWNSLTKTQKDENAALFKGVNINVREVRNENSRRLPALQEAIHAGTFGHAVELATPMAQADPAAFGPVVAVLMFLNNDRAALRWSNALKPEQLIRMDLFTETQMNQVVQGALFRSYLDDVIGGNPDRIIAGLRAPIEKPGTQRRALEAFQQAFANAKAGSNSEARLKTLRDLGKQYPDHLGEIAPELASTARLEGARLYRTIGTLLSSVGDGHLMNGGTIKYTVKEIAPCDSVRFESTTFLPSNYSRGSYFRWSTSVTIRSDAEERISRLYFTVGVSNPHNDKTQGDNPSLTVLSKDFVSVDEEHQNYQLFKGENIGWTQHHQSISYTFLFDPKTPDAPAQLLKLFEAAREACKL